MDQLPTMLTASVVVLTAWGCSYPPEQGARVSGSELTAEELCLSRGKVVLCHVPADAPDDARTLCVGSPALLAHLGHGDSEGACSDPAPLEPSISPAEGARGAAFTISDPQGRIQPGSIVLFYKDGQDYAVDGIAADEIVISDAFTLQGVVPQPALDGENLVSVGPSRTSLPYFTALTFTVR